MARRLDAAGIGIWFEPAAAISHVGPGSLRDLAVDTARRSEVYTTLTGQRERWSSRMVVRELRLTAGQIRAAWSARPDTIGSRGAVPLAGHVVVGAAAQRVGRLRVLTGRSETSGGETQRLGPDPEGEQRCAGGRPEEIAAGSPTAESEGDVAQSS